MWQKLQLQLKNKLDKNKKIFFAELIGTFTVIVCATGSVVLDAKLNGALGLPFIAIAPAIAVTIGIYLFGKISMAHFNPAVTVGFLITKHLERKKVTVDLSFSRNHRCCISKYFHIFYSWT